jgi:hypothetical protein
MAPPQADLLSGYTLYEHDLVERLFLDAESAFAG